MKNNFVGSNENKNAIILAAGRSTSLAPFIYERPKGTFSVKGEVLIERQIRQLQEAGVSEIVVVVGYMKEKFFYLEKKFGVKFVVNNEFSKGNVLSLYKAREYLGNTFVCCADHYFLENPFLENNEGNISFLACTFISGKFDEFAVASSDAEVITQVSFGGEDNFAMVGHAYFNETFSKKFVTLMEESINDFGVKNMFWEEFYERNIASLTLFKKTFEFD